MSTSAAKQESVDVGDGRAAGFTGLVLQDTYTLGRRIGRGGMGEVYEATHVRLPGRMAVKILRPHLRTNEDAFARFCREAEIMSAVQHPHVIQIFDFNTSTSLDGLPYFVMEHLDGVNLEERLADSGPLSVAATVRIVDAVASALGAAHAAGVVHRDLKPANIFLMRGEGQDADFVKVIDFGISKCRGSGPRLSNPSDVIGTPEFMAPEQALGLVRKIDGRTDQFALAAITYAMLTGQKPFVGHDPAALLYQVVHERHPPLSRFLSWDTRGIQAVLDRALAKRQEDRFEGVVEFARALEAAAGLSADGDRQAAVEHPPAPPVRAPVEDGPPPIKRPPVELRSIRPATFFGDIDLPRSVNRVPRGPQRRIALGLAALGLAAFVVHKGWYHGFAGRVLRTEHNLVSLVRGSWRAARPHVPVPAPEATPLPVAPREAPPGVEVPPGVKVQPPIVGEVPPPATAPASGDLATAREAPARSHATASPASRRHTRPHRKALSRSGWQSIDIVSLPPSSSPSEDAAASPKPEAPASPPTAIPDGFSIPEPAPLPPARDLAPAPAPSE